MNAVIVFARYPRQGRVKTRLSNTLTSEFATGFYKLMAEHSFDICLSLPQEEHDLHFFYDNVNDLESVKNWVDNRFSLHLQVGMNLGDKMKDAFRVIFKNRYEKVIIIGTDCPEITVNLLLKSFEELSYKNIAAGPSIDGGYYLLGMDKFYPFLFDEIEWSSNTVFAETIKRVTENKLSMFILPELIDIDTEEDLKKWLSKSPPENAMTEFIDLYGLR
jgi:rSAM/selenodomain-associated transferase 1